MARLLFVALTLASTALFVLPTGRVAAQINISGQWALALTHPDFTGTIYCAAAIGQGGTTLSSAMTCDYFGSGTLSGSIDTTTGAFTLSGTMSSGDQLDFQGTAAGNGSSMAGAWVVIGIPAQGSFNGNRTSAVGGVTELASVGYGLSRSAGGSLPAWWNVIGVAVGIAACSSFVVAGMRRYVRSRSPGA